MKAWAFVPARGGSKSIPQKNLVRLGGIPLIEYGIRAAQASGRFERIVCSTEDRHIAEAAQKLGIEIDERPNELAGDDVSVADVAREFLTRQSSHPDVLALVQPTSPFLLPEQIAKLLDEMSARPDTNSGQTIAECPHNHHAWNQREIENKIVRFRFAEERSRAYNKQKKPKLFVFGNLVAVRPAALVAGASFFAEPSCYIEIERPYDFDLDCAQDVDLAEALLKSGAVQLPHLQT
jgi:CMP-N,N'-diacetyllegionaminic acid synthase